MPLRALIFDFDGLILDTETPEVRAWQRVFRDRGAEFPDAWWIHAIGRGAEQILESPCDLLDRQLGYPCERREVEEEYQRLRMSAIEAADALPGVRDLISEARESGLRLGIASSSKHAWVDRHLDRLGLLDLFEAILCADDVENAKPFPDLYLGACERLEVVPRESTALEDSPNGIRAAKSAGLWCVAIPNPCTVQLNLSEADHRVDSAAELDIPFLHTLADRASVGYAGGMDEEIQKQFEGIVEEMKSAGIWEIARPSDEAFANMGAFGLNTMAFEQWLRWVFVPTIEERLTSGGPWPSSSSVGTMAIRNFDGQSELDGLVSQLCEFDRLF